MLVLLYVTSLFSLKALKILFLSLTLDNLIKMCLSIALVKFNFFGAFWPSWLCPHFRLSPQVWEVFSQY